MIGRLYRNFELKPCQEKGEYGRECTAMKLDMSLEVIKFISNLKLIIGVRSILWGHQMKLIALIAGFIFVLMLISCTGVPEGLEPVTGFEPNRYLGKWYEIARLDHSFERDLSNVTAHYSRKKNGEIVVINRGFNVKKGEWKEIEGRARFIKTESVGSLKVSFFGPFYGGYHIIALST